MVAGEEELSFLEGKLQPEVELTSLGINSLLFIKLVVAIEDEFDIEFDDDDLDAGKLKTVEDFMDYIEARLEN